VSLAESAYPPVSWTLSDKVYEYLASGRSILAAVTPDGAAAELVREVGAGSVVDPDDIEGMVGALTEPRDRWRASDLLPVKFPEKWRDAIRWQSRADELRRVVTFVAGNENGQPSGGPGAPVSGAGLRTSAGGSSP
jgi:hypothetical protein